MALLRLVLADRSNIPVRPEEFRITVLTVDHGLRAGAAGEAAQVAAWCARLGVPHVTLRWEGDKPTGNLQEAAREARYVLMLDWCRANGATVLATAHTAEDQAETLLMRMARGTGLHGLAGIQRQTEQGGVRIVRPFLELGHADLRAYLDEVGQPWLEDPSNQDPRFARTRARQALALLDGDGRAAARMARLAGEAAALRDDREELARWLADVYLPLQPGGFCLVQRTWLGEAPSAILRLALARRLREVGGNPAPPDNDLVEWMMHDLYGDGLIAFDDVRRTGHRCLYHLSHRSAASSYLCRERRFLPEPRALDGEAFWDGRFELRGGGGATVAPLGEAGWQAVRAAQGDAKPAVFHLAAVTTPALWDGDRLLAAPVLGYRTADAPPFRVTFAPRSAIVNPAGPIM